MAGEWIKVEAATADKPEVLRMARILKIDRDAVFGKLTRLWAWFDCNSVDGVVDGVVDADIDRICYCDGFTAACVAVGWLEYDARAERVSLPNFDRHNGETAKQRALKNRRQANWRKSVDGNVDKSSSTEASTREEKRREEKEKKEKTARKRATPKCDFQTFIDACQSAGELPIPADDPIYAYAESIGLPDDFLALAWGWFKAKRAGAMQAGVPGWRAHFRDAVKGNWPKFWYPAADGSWTLTTAGEQARRASA